MSGKRHPNKAMLNIWVPRHMLKRIKKEAKQRNETVSQFVVNILNNATMDVVLTPEDYEDIARETERAIKHLRSYRNQEEH